MRTISSPEAAGGQGSRWIEKRTVLLTRPIGRQSQRSRRSCCTRGSGCVSYRLALNPRMRPCMASMRSVNHVCKAAIPFRFTLEPVSKRYERREVAYRRSAGTAVYMRVNEDSEHRRDARSRRAVVLRWVLVVRSRFVHVRPCDRRARYAMLFSRPTSNEWRVADAGIN
jgi:hypothetical protein